VIVTGDGEEVVLGVRVYVAVASGVRVMLAVVMASVRVMMAEGGIIVWVGSEVAWCVAEGRIFTGVLVAVSLPGRNGNLHDARLDKKIPVIRKIAHTFSCLMLGGIVCRDPSSELSILLGSLQFME
jgi:hypothetical protein